MKLLSIDGSSFIPTKCPYTNMSAVNCSNYIWETGHCCKLHIVVGLFTHRVRQSDVPICQFMASMMEFKHSWDIPDLLSFQFSMNGFWKSKSSHYRVIIAARKSWCLKMCFCLICQFAWFSKNARNTHTPYTTHYSIACKRAKLLHSCLQPIITHN